jgi:DNA-binding NarL/FixJ family response regulator
VPIKGSSRQERIIISRIRRFDLDATLYKVSSIVLKLTPRQRQVVSLLLMAEDNKFIAKELGITENAVKSHFNHIYKANGITCGDKRVKLAAMAYREKRKVNGS